MVSVGAEGIPMPTQGLSGGSVVTQDLFEHVLANSRASSAAVTPPELMGNAMEKLGGFLERYQSFSQRESDFHVKSADRSDSAASSDDKSENADLAMSDERYDKVIGSLSAVFNHAIETGLVVRGCTQISGACNTLLRGQ